MSNRRGNLLIAAILLLIGGIVLTAIIIEIARVTAVDYVEGKVVDKYIKRYDDADKFFFIVEKQDGSREVLQNTDELWFWKFNSADVYANIEVGKCYRFKVVGWRIPFWSMFRNVVKYEEIGSWV